MYLVLAVDPGLLLYDHAVQNSSSGQVEEIPADASECSSCCIKGGGGGGEDCIEAAVKE
jgi:hypothetical protein